MLTVVDSNVNLFCGFAKQVGSPFRLNNLGWGRKMNGFNPASGMSTWRNCPITAEASCLAFDYQERDQVAIMVPRPSDCNHLEALVNCF